MILALGQHSMVAAAAPLIAMRVAACRRNVLSSSSARILGAWLEALVHHTPGPAALSSRALSSVVSR